VKTILLVSVLAVGLTELDGLVDSLNVWVELGVKVFGLAAVVGGAWRWVIGPGYQKVRSVVCWVREQLEMISTVDDRLDSMEEELSRGHEHFARIDESLAAFTSDEALAVRRAVHEHIPVKMRDDDPGRVDRRVSPPDRRADLY
jgi:hypothetical protein